jgi:co-chaperonin GroES (HSP10)
MTAKALKLVETAPKAPFNPPGYYILVLLKKAAEKTGGGIYIPGAARDVMDTRANTGTVVAVGPDAYRDASRFGEPWCKVGDFIGWKRYQDQRYKVGGEEYVVIADDKVDAVFPDPGVLE